MWQSEWDDIMREHYKQPGKMSASQLGVTLGTTKGSVMNAARRLGLQDAGSRSGYARRTHETRPKVQWAEMPAIPQLEPVLPVVMPPVPAVPVIAAPKLAPYTPSTVSPWRKCQWIDDEQATMESPKCGAACVPGHSWCSEHFDRVFVTRKAKAA